MKTSRVIIRNLAIAHFIILLLSVLEHPEHVKVFARVKREGGQHVNTFARSFIHLNKGKNK
jgi:hypothetical protein